MDLALEHRIRAFTATCRCLRVLALRRRCGAFAEVRRICVYTRHVRLVLTAADRLDFIGRQFRVSSVDSLEQSGFHRTPIGTSWRHDCFAVCLAACWKIRPFSIGAVVAVATVTSASTLNTNITGLQTAELTGLDAQSLRSLSAVFCVEHCGSVCDRYEF